MGHSQETGCPFVQQHRETLQQAELRSRVYFIMMMMTMLMESLPGILALQSELWCFTGTGKFTISCSVTHSSM
ncbi:hypothetical protein Q7C36_021164 [Tachysurus vachellii]|uniref:Uncharacterized protein n=1 Tax=Tachysurus vachellii TaxID=175792 RepID=A0AA88ISM8_TACVA|nr:hypothetical protein Q7C36_021164 [Tachysurus vachellii]